jgi:hypothetical protein
MLNTLYNIEYACVFVLCCFFFEIKVISFIDAGTTQPQFSRPAGKQIVSQILINEENA